MPGRFVCRNRGESSTKGPEKRISLRFRWWVKFSPQLLSLEALNPERLDPEP